MPNHNPFKSDVFVMGMIVLELGLLEYQDEVYNRSKFIVNEHLLTKKLAIFEKAYG